MSVVDCGWLGLAKQECVVVWHEEIVGEHVNSGGIYSHSFEFELVSCKSDDDCRKRKKKRRTAER